LEVVRYNTAMQRSTRILGIALLVLAAIAAVIWLALIHEDRGRQLRVSFLDIGQGDAIFIDAPSGRQVLIDGGPADGGILRRLPGVIPWYDRSIDVIIPTHPDADHIAGLIGVMSRYQVSYIVHSDVAGDTATAQELVASMRREGAKDVVAQRGQIIDLGPSNASGQGVHVYLEVLSPDRRVQGVATNDGCVVTRLVYGKTAFMLSCDAPQSVEKYLVTLDGKAIKSDVLKAGHHGSRTSSAPLFVGFVNPAAVVYSRRCDNTFGFPHRETVDTMARFGIPVADTCTEGTITYVSDGETVWRE
jgi:competence protein ComEC